jgi:hypothetical protein
MMLITEPVRFRFSPAEQKLLFCSLLHDTDEDIATDLGLSLDTLRKQFRSIYQRVLMVDPCFFDGEGAAEIQGNARGRGKRRWLLRYLRMHMEELRPHRPLARARQRAGAAESIAAHPAE